MGLLPLRLFFKELHDQRQRRFHREPQWTRASFEGGHWQTSPSPYPYSDTSGRLLPNTRFMSPSEGLFSSSLATRQKISDVLRGAIPLEQTHSSVAVGL